MEIKPPEADQRTAVFDVPETVAENCFVAPAATVADVGLILTATLPVAGVGVAGDAEVPAQPARLSAASSKKGQANLPSRDRKFPETVISRFFKHGALCQRTQVSEVHAG